MSVSRIAISFYSIKSVVNKLGFVTTVAKACYYRKMITNGKTWLKALWWIFQKSFFLIKDGSVL